MSAYFALLGNSPILSDAEITALHVSCEPTDLEQLIKLDFENDQQAADFLEKTGGVVKILKQIAELDTLEKETVLAALVEAFKSEKKVTFALSQIGRGSSMPVSAQELKKALKDQNISARYLNSSGDQLSAAVLLHQPDTTELMLVNLENSYLLLETVAIQNIDAWTTRDRKKPYADRKKGMLPPKVARIMVNLGLENTQEQPTLYDPFCGTGTVLLEAGLRNCQVIGSDIDKEAVTGTQTNLDWFNQEYNLESDFKVFHQDVTQAINQLSPQSVDLIVTEPFLGKPRPQPHKVPDIFKGLEKLYIGAFKRWTQILKDGAQVVIVFPKVTIGKKTYTLDSLIDKLEKIGYTTTLGPLPYSREQATVKRQIYRFTYNQK